MSVIVRTPHLVVSVDGREVTNRLSARCSFGYDLRTSEATVLVPEQPSWAKHWSTVHIQMGMLGTVNDRLRFVGYLVAVDYTLWPRAVQLICRGPLVRAEQTQCSTLGGIDMAGAGTTDSDLIFAPTTGILARCGLVSGSDGSGNPIGVDGVHVTAGGTGRALGTVAGAKYYWNEGESALSYIERIDQISVAPTSGSPGHWDGYRTYDTLGGNLRRDVVTMIPASASATSFTEGVDIFSGSAQQTIMPIANRAQVTGFNSGTAAVTATLQQSNPNVIDPTGYITQQLSSELIEKSYAADSGDGVACDEVAAWLLQEQNRLLLYKVTLETPRDDLMGPNQTITVHSPNRLGLPDASPTNALRIQHVDVQIDERGQFSQTLTCIGGLSSTAPLAAPPRADFAITVDTEKVVISGAESALYTVYCAPASIGLSGTITSYAWTASGGTPSSGTAEDFTTTYTSITTQTITLSVTDSNGLSATLTKPIPTNVAKYVARRLYLAGTTSIDDFDGQTWRVASESSATVVANAPIWGAGGTAYYTGDDLATAPSSSSLFGSGTVTALWVETDVSSSRVLAGGSAGGVAYSTNGGASWTAAAAPDGHAVLRVIMSRVVPKQFFALTTAGLYRSDNLGSGWVTVLAAAGGETFRDVSISSPRFMIAMSGGRLLCDGSGTAQTFPSLSPAVSDVYAVTAGRVDTCLCYDSTGRTFASSGTGSTTMTQRASLPGGTTPEPRGLWRDGAIWGVLYIACGSAGCYKSVDGLQSSGGYYRLRQPGVGTSPGGAVYTQIGADGLLVPALAPIAPTSVLSTPGAEKTYNLGSSGGGYSAEPFGWSATDFDASAWTASVDDSTSEAGGGGASISGATWITDAGGTGSLPGSQKWLARRAFSLPSGTIAAATLQVVPDADLIAVYVNGLFLAGPVYGSYTAVQTISVPLTLLHSGATNVLGLVIRNGTGTMTLQGTSAVQYALAVS